MADPERQDVVALAEAVCSGDLDTLRTLLAERPELAGTAGEHDKTGLHWAAEHDQVEAARLLLEAGADLEASTSWGASPLDWAATMGGQRVADLLLAVGAGGLTLISAAALGKRDIVVTMLQASSDDLAEHARRDAPSEPDEHWPPDSAHLLGDVLSDALYAAARNGHADVVAHLLHRGARADAKGVFGGSGLHWAAMNGHAETVRVLIRAGADVRARDHRFASTPREWAVEGGHPGIAAMLAAAGG